MNAKQKAQHKSLQRKILLGQKVTRKQVMLALKLQRMAADDFRLIKGGMGA